MFNIDIGSNSHKHSPIARTIVDGFSLFGEPVKQKQIKPDDTFILDNGQFPDLPDLPDLPDREPSVRSEKTSVSGQRSQQPKRAKTDQITYTDEYLTFDGEYIEQNGIEDWAYNKFLEQLSDDDYICYTTQLDNEEIEHWSEYSYTNLPADIDWLSHYYDDIGIDFCEPEIPAELIDDFGDRIYKYTMATINV